MTSTISSDWYMHYVSPGVAATSCGKILFRISYTSSNAFSIDCPQCIETDEFRAAQMEFTLLASVPKGWAGCTICKLTGLHPTQEPDGLTRLCDRCKGTGKVPVT